MHGMESAAAEAMCEALTAAAARGHEATVRRLCECPDLLAATASAPSGCPAIRVACLLSGADRAPEEKAAVRERIVQTLVYGAVPTDAPDADGNRALHIAAGRGLTHVVDLLLAAGADAAARNGRAELPADLARSSGHDGLAATLQHAAEATATAAIGAAAAALPPLTTPQKLAPLGGALPPLAVSATPMAAAPAPLPGVGHTTAGG